MIITTDKDRFDKIIDDMAKIYGSYRALSIESGVNLNTIHTWRRKDVQKIPLQTKNLEKLVLSAKQRKQFMKKEQKELDGIIKEISKIYL